MLPSRKNAESTLYGGRYLSAGFIVGPIIGRFAAAINYSAPFLVATAVIVFTMIWGFFFCLKACVKTSDNFIRVGDLNPLKQFGNVFALRNLPGAAGWLLLCSHLRSCCLNCDPIEDAGMECN